MKHKAPWECTYAKEDSSICRPGKKPASDNEYFEILSLIVFQSGLSWGLVRKKWSKIKESFSNFLISKVAKFDSTDLKSLLNNPDTIRNKKKIKAIIYNAKKIQEIIVEYGSFKAFLGELRSKCKKMRVEELIKRFKYIGEYSAEYFLHSVGE